MRKTLRLFSLALLFCGITAVLAVPAHVQGAGGSSGGSVKPVEIRVTGFITGIDYETGLVSVGTSYYGSGKAWVTTTTKLSLDNVSCDLVDIQVGDWAELRYDAYTHVANKIAAISY